MSMTPNEAAAELWEMHKQEALDAPLKGYEVCITVGSIRAQRREYLLKAASLRHAVNMAVGHFERDLQRRIAEPSTLVIIATRNLFFDETTKKGGACGC